MEKRFATGMYGGKFLPYHRGHLSCLETASAMCGQVWQLVMAGSAEEERILRGMAEAERQALSPAARYLRAKAAGDRLGNVKTILLDISGCLTPDGEDDWDAETPLVLETCGRFDAVFGSEPEYETYFRRAYPWAEYILVDPARTRVPVSGSQIRENWEDTAAWRV